MQGLLVAAALAGDDASVARPLDVAATSHSTRAAAAAANRHSPGGAVVEEDAAEADPLAASRRRGAARDEKASGAIAAPPLRPVSDIVSASSIIDIQPPIQFPGRSTFSPLVGGDILESSG